jgi:hypothetical protein
MNGVWSRVRAIAVVVVAVTILPLAACSAKAESLNTSTTRNSAPLANPGQRTLDAYRGLGAWIDVFDYVPAFQREGVTPPVTPATMRDLAALGVATVFVQVSRDDPRSPNDIVDAPLVSEMVRSARRAGMRIVGWYAPKLVDVDADLRRLQAMDTFRVDASGLDGIGVDIESLDNADVVSRNQAIVQLSQRLRAAVQGTISAIVLPAVQIEVVNNTYWPMFPWSQLASSYDIWLPMAYATFRKEPYRDHRRYITESVQRMRANLGNKQARVHVIGGIGDKMTPEDYSAVRQAAIDTKALGWSVYDVSTMGTTGWAPLRGS